MSKENYELRGEIVKLLQADQLSDECVECIYDVICDEDEDTVELSQAYDSYAALCNAKEED